MKDAGYAFFWSGRGPEERREAGAGFAIKSMLVGKLADPPKGVNDLVNYDSPFPVDRSLPPLPALMPPP